MIKFTPWPGADLVFGSGARAWLFAKRIKTRIGVPAKYTERSEGLCGERRGGEAGGVSALLAEMELSAVYRDMVGVTGIEPVTSSV